MDRRTFVLTTVAGVAIVVTASAQPTTPPTSRPRWGQQAEREFRMGRGLAPQLMTEEEWKEHQAKMRTMTPDERKAYREQVHQQMLERAKERHIAVPPAPRGQ